MTGWISVLTPDVRLEKRQPCCLPALPDFMGLFEEHRALSKLLGSHLSVSLLGEGDE